MAEFIGALGAMLMIALIVILFFKFLLDIGVDKDRVYRKQIAGFAFPALILVILQFAYGAIVTHVAYEGAMVFDVTKIWYMLPVTDLNELVTSYSFSAIADKGAMPLYYILSGAFASVLYKMYEQCALYISMLSGIVTYVMLGLLFSKNSELDGNNERTGQMFMLLLCLPGSVFLFLPSDLSLGVALFSVFLYIWNGGRGNKVASVVMAVLCCLTHVSGVCALVVFIAGCIYRTDGNAVVVRDVVAILLTQFVVTIVCVVNEWGSTPEYIIVFGIAALIGVNGLRIKMNHIVVSLVNMIMIIVNGFWLTRMIYGIM